MSTAEIRDGAEVVAAALNLAMTWAGYAAYDNARHMTQTEMDAMARLFVVCGQHDAARELMEAWIDAEIEDGEIVRGQVYVTDTINGPMLVDTRED